MNSIANCVSTLFHFRFIFIGLTIICFSPELIVDQVDTIKTSNEAFSKPITLKGVFMVMRHGARAPIHDFPSDPTVNSPHNWPNGLGQLTDIGKNQIKDIGHFIRKRYAKFYPRNLTNAFLRTSNVDRCINTMSIVSRILWPPKSSPSYQPPSVYKVSRPIDSVLYYDPYCPNAQEQLYVKRKLKPEAIAFDEQHKSLYDLVANKTGLKPNIDDMNKAFDVLRSLKYHNLVMPDWANKDVYEELGDVFTKLWNLWNADRASIKFKSGMFLKELSKRIHQVIDQTNKRNFFFYVSHDDLIASLIGALGLPLLEYPNFGSGIIFELHEIKSKNMLKIFYMNQTETLPIGVTKMRLPGCQKHCLNEQPCFTKPRFACDFNSFENMIADLIPNNWAKECGIEADYDYIQVLENYIDLSDELIDRVKSV